MPQPIRYGLLGASQIARSQHIPAIRQVGSAVLQGIASRSYDKAAAWARELGIARSYHSYEAMLDDPDIDAVLITLPMSLHVEWIIRAIEVGKHVLCEKPMVLSVEEIDRVISGARARGVHVLEGFTHVYPGHLDEVQALIDAGEIGDVRAVRAEVIYPTFDWQKDTRANGAYGACVLIEAGCYCVHTILRFMQADPVGVCGFGASRAGCDFETTFAGVLRFDRERMGYLCTSMETAFRAVCDIIGTAGRIELPDLFGGTEIVIHSLDGKARHLRRPAVNRFAVQIEQFGRTIRDGAPPAVSLTESRRIIRALVQLRDAGRAAVATLR
ncbi:Gfo/Idh/MocA family oxidoreductase [Oscillatoria amoena NRMC-F 0135]|nr:Gfo/Idh/MocA family oxidoreductase [Oscillatoria amoena NRMC-F 0135]